MQTYAGLNMCMTVHVGLYDRVIVCRYVNLNPDMYCMLAHGSRRVSACMLVHSMSSSYIRVYVTFHEESYMFIVCSCTSVGQDFPPAYGDL